MKDLFKLILGVLTLLFKSRAKLEAQILILRQRSMCFAGGHRNDDTSTIPIVFCLFGLVPLRPWRVLADRRSRLSCARSLARIVVSATKRWVAEFPENTDFWINHGVGRRVCTLFEKLFVGKLTDEGLRMEVDAILAARRRCESPGDCPRCRQMIILRICPAGKRKSDFINVRFTPKSGHSSAMKCLLWASGHSLMPVLPRCFPTGRVILSAQNYVNNN
jgi:hypothetical protein